MLVHAIEVLLILMPLALIDVSVRVEHLASALTLILHVPVSFVLVAFRVDHLYIALNGILVPVSCEQVTIFVGQFALAFAQSFQEQAFKRILVSLEA